VLLALSLLAPGLVRAQLVFQDAADLPEPLIFHAYATDGAAVYCVNGQSTASRTLSTQVLKYDPATNASTVLVEGLEPKISAVAEYVPATGKLYVLGGKDPRDPAAPFFTGVEAVDVKTGKLEKLALTNPRPASTAARRSGKTKSTSSAAPPARARCPPSSRCLIRRRAPSPACPTCPPVGSSTATS
jgi:hypothetical protein